MTLPDPTDVVAPREGDAYEPLDFLQEMMYGAYPVHTVLEYHGFQLYSQHLDDGTARVWDVYTAEGKFIETLNLEAFRTVTELEETLDEIVADDPADREEWLD